MKVLLISKKDYCNVGYTFSKCLQKVGIEATMFARVKNGYPDHGQILPKEILDPELKCMLEEYDTIIFMHSDFANDINMMGKRVFVFHGGSAYRKYSKEMNRLFNNFVQKSLIQTGDLLGRGAKNEVWTMAAVDTEKIQPVYKDISDKIIISHFPSGFHRNVKGSDIIENVIKKLQTDETTANKFIYNFSPEKVSWEENLKRISECDIYLEACKPIIDGFKYGEFGITGMEAAALGKVLVTHFLSSEKYKLEFGQHPVQVVNSEKDIEKVLRKLLKMSSSEIRDLQIKTREWVERFHSFEVVGKKLKEILTV